MCAYVRMPAHAYMCVCAPPRMRWHAMACDGMRWHANTCVGKHACMRMQTLAHTVVCISSLYVCACTTVWLLDTHCLCAHVHVYAYAYMCAPTNLLLRARICMDAHAHAYMRVHACAMTYIHVCVRNGHAKVILRAHRCMYVYGSTTITVCMLRRRCPRGDRACVHTRT